MTYFLNFRARPVGNGVRDKVEIQQITLGPNGPAAAVLDPLASELARAVRGKDVMLVTHGFNVSQQDGYAKLMNWQTLLQLGDAYFFIGMVWPGDSSWLGPLCYPGEGRHAIQCGDMLADFIQANLVGASSLSFVSHSLGARFILEAIAKLDKKIPVKQVAVMAGAINDDCFVAEYKSATDNIGKINILASEKDEVLSLAFPLGNVFEGIIDKGHPYWEAALGHDGPNRAIPDRPTGGYEILSGWNYGHHNYIEVQPALNPLLPLPQNLPPPTGSCPSQPGWQPSWSAAFVSTRFLADTIKS